MKSNTKKNECLNINQFRNMKNFKFCLLSILSLVFLISCTGSGSKTIELTPAQKDSIEKVKQASLEHAKEQQRINDSIKHVKDSLQAIEYRKQEIAEIDKLLKECEISRFEDIASFNSKRERIASAISSENDAKQKSKWTTALKAVYGN